MTRESSRISMVEVQPSLSTHPCHLSTGHVPGPGSHCYDPCKTVTFVYEALGLLVLSLFLMKLSVPFRHV